MLFLPESVYRSRRHLVEEIERGKEPAAVTSRLRKYRLIQELQESENIDESLVDEILAEGPAVIPLLVGVLRDWAQMATRVTLQRASGGQARTFAKTARFEQCVASPGFADRPMYDH